MVMMINELNTGLIEALKEKLPPKTNLANLLMDTLYIGRKPFIGAYWRGSFHLGRGSSYLKEIGCVIG